MGHFLDHFSRWSRKWLLVHLLGISTKAIAKEDMQVDFRAEQLESDIIDEEPCKKLKNNVFFGLEKCIIQADSAIYYKNRRLIEAQGRVRIVHEDGSTILADQLFYDEKDNLAKLRGQVIYTSGEVTFHTDHFDYNTETKQGRFMQGGKLIEGDNVLTSESGYYNDLDKAATFEQGVELSNPDYTLQCDSLAYNTVTKIAKFAGTTQITSKDGKHTLITHEEGEYNTGNQQSTFIQSKVETDAYTLYGDLMRADRIAGVYTVTGRVRLVAKDDDVVLEGDHGQCKKKEGTAQVYGNALMTKHLGEDTLYLSADTFLATESKLNDGQTKTTVRAYHNVKLYKEDLQGKADSLVYQSTDSMIHFDGDPIFWSGGSQLTADTVYLLLRDKALSEMHMDNHAFVASEDVTGNYNQLRGRNMTAFFKENKIASIEIEGNAESIYFVADDQGRLKGMNHLQCSAISMAIEDEEIGKIKFNTKPIGAFYPSQKVVEGVKKLDNFYWRGHERPTKQEVIAHGYGTCEAYKQFKLLPER